MELEGQAVFLWQKEAKSMRDSLHIRMHGREASCRRAVESALWNAGILTLMLLTVVIIFFGLLAVLAN